MDSMSEIDLLSIHEALQEMQDGTLSPQALTEACFRQIERLNPKLNAFITVCDDVIERAEDPKAIVSSTRSLLRYKRHGLQRH